MKPQDTAGKAGTGMAAGFKTTGTGGFTLIEIAIAMAVVGIMLGGAVFAYPRYVHQEQVAATNRQLDTIMNVLSAYVQRHNRLPCPARASGDGLEHKTVTTAAGPNTSCFDNSDTNALYENTQGILPWRELGIPESMTRDAWGRLITYKPAAQLTLDMSDARMQDLGNAETMAIHNACRSPMWYTLDDAGNPVHTKRAQALFCCNALPKPAYKNGGGPVNWRMQTLRAAGQDTTQSVVQSPAWMDPSTYDADSDWSNKAADFNGSFAAPRLAGFGGQSDTLADAPLIRASTNAVTLISHGGNGFLAYALGSDTQTLSDDNDIGTAETDNARDFASTSGTIYNSKLSQGSYDRTGQMRGASDDIVSYIRSDQLYAKAGKASCMPNNNRHNCAQVVTEDAKPMEDVSYVLDKSGSMRSTVACQPGSAYCGRSLDYVVNDSLNWVIPKLVEAKLEGDPNTTDTIRLSTLHRQLTPVTMDPGNINYYTPEGTYNANNATVTALQSQVTNLSLSNGSPIAQSVLDMVRTMGTPADPNKPNVIILMSDGENNDDLTLPCAACPRGRITYPYNSRNSSTRTASNLAIMTALKDYIVENYPGVQIYGVQISDLSNSGTSADALNMQTLSEATGGKYIRVRAPDDLKGIFNGIVHNSITTCL